MSNENATPNPTVQKLRDFQNRPLTPKEILLRMIITAFLMFVAGFILITVWAYAGGYPSLPVQGDVQLQATGEQKFVPYYPIFNRFAITKEGEVRPTESLFDHIGPLGIGSYFYSVVNAPHWCLELNAPEMPFCFFDIKYKTEIQMVNGIEEEVQIPYITTSDGYLRGMEFIPYIMLLFGMMFFFKVMIPNHQHTPQSILNYSIVISLFHSIFVILMLLIALILSDSYQELYKNYNFYQGQFIGTIAPGICLIFVYALFIGALIGTIYSSLLYYFYLALIFFGVVKAPQHKPSTVKP